MAKNCRTSVDQINFTVWDRSLFAVSVRHWAATTQSLSTCPGVLCHIGVN